MKSLDKQKIKLVTGETEYFKGIGKIKFEGRKSDNPFSFKWYNEKQKVNGKSMKDHLRFAVAY